MNRHRAARENLAGFALGALAPAQAQAVAEHVASCEECARELAEMRQATEHLGLAALPVDPPPDLRRRVLSEIAALGCDHQVIRREEGRWRDAGIPGLQIKRLPSAPGSDAASTLVRMAPGTRYPAHRHKGVEQCYVLEGDFWISPREVLRAGDFLSTVGEGFHETSWTESGCLLLIISNSKDEFVPAGGT
jgi:putative transcriptional regulator